MLSAAKRTNRIRFERRVPGAKSASGNILDEWSLHGEAWAGFRPQFGREQVASGRLESALLGTLTVLAWPMTQGVVAADRVVFIVGPYVGRIFEIVSIVPTPDAREIEMTLRGVEG